MKVRLALLPGVVLGAGVMFSNLGSSAAPPSGGGSLVNPAPAISIAETVAPRPTLTLEEANPLAGMTLVSHWQKSAPGKTPPAAMVFSSPEPTISIPSATFPPPTPADDAPIKATPAGKTLANPVPVTAEALASPASAPLYNGHTSSPACEAPGCSKGGGFYAAAGAYFLVPRWSDAPAFDVQRVFVAPGGITRRNVGTTFIDEEPEFAPRVWVGYTSECGLGVRGSWWYFDSEVDQGATFGGTGPGETLAVTVPGLSRANDDIVGLGAPNDQGVFQFLVGPGSTATLEINTRLQMHVFDLDATQEWQSANWNVVLGGGARYADINQRYAARALSTAGAVQNNQSLALTNDFWGVGPQAFIEAQRRLGSSGFGLYGNARAGVLFGEADLSATQLQRVTTAGVVTTDAVSLNTTNSSATRPYLEFEAGVEFRGTYGGLSPFLRVGVVGQNWFDMGSPSSNATNREGDLGLFGFSVMAGVSF